MQSRRRKRNHRTSVRTPQDSSVPQDSVLRSHGESSDATNSHTSKDVGRGGKKRVHRAIEESWFELRVVRELASLFRCAVFILVALEWWMRISRGPYYAVQTFNVSHLPSWAYALLIAHSPSIIPSPERMVAYWLIGTFLAWRAALGMARSWEYVVMCALYGYVYFISQLDSYQHHYFVFLLLLLSAIGACCGDAWPICHDTRAKECPKDVKSNGERNNVRKGKSKKKPLNVNPSKPSATKTPSTHTMPNDVKHRHASWTLKLILATTSIVYVYTVVAKMDQRWTSGALLHRIVSPQFRALADTFWTTLWGVTDATSMDEHASALPFFWPLASCAVMVMELALAIALQMPHDAHWIIRMMIVMCGVSLHAGMHISGLRIELFSFFMIGLYILMLPSGAATIIRRCNETFSSVAKGAYRRMEASTYLTIGLSLMFLILSIAGPLIWIPLPLPSLYHALCVCVVVCIIAIIIESICTERDHLPRKTGDGSTHRPKRVKSIKRALIRTSTSLFSWMIFLMVLQATSSQVRLYYFNAANIQAGLMNQKEAIEQYALAAKADPTYGDAFTDGAFFMEWDGKEEEALDQHRHVVQHIDSMNVKALAGIMRITLSRFQRNTSPNGPSPSEVCKAATATRNAAQRLLDRACPFWTQAEDCEKHKRFARGYALPMAHRTTSTMKCDGFVPSDFQVLGEAKE